MSFDARVRGETEARRDLAHQCQGRDLSAEENALADAMMKIYGEGVHEPQALADALNAQNIVIPDGSSGPWTVEKLQSELDRLNAELGDAYKVNGYGA